MSITVKQNILTRSDCYRSAGKITPTCMQLHTIGTAQNSASALVSYWNQPGISACVHYCVDAEHEGLVYQLLPDNWFSFADAGYGNRHAITVELMESDYMRYTGGASYVITDEAKFRADMTRAYNTAVQFFAMKCKEYGWNPQEKMSNGLHRIFSHNEGRLLGLSSAHVDPIHVWQHFGWTMDKFRADVAYVMNNGELLTPEPTPVVIPVSCELFRVRTSWDNEKSQIFAGTLEGAKKQADSHTGYKVYNEKGVQVYPEVKKETPAPTKSTGKPSGIPTSKAQYIKDVAGIATALYKETKILPSVVIAQCCLETGYGLGNDSTELVKRNNLLGMKTDLINGTWKKYTVWDGETFSKKTPEYYNGQLTYITDSFRVYTDYENCIRDYEMFLLHVQNNQGYKYNSIAGMTDPAKIIHIIRVGQNGTGGYCTDPNYETKILKLIKENDLEVYDKLARGGKDEPEVIQLEEDPAPTSAPQYYRIAKEYKDGKYIDHKGAYTVKENALKNIVVFPGYKVFDPTGEVIYPETTQIPTSGKQYRVQTGVYMLIDNANNMVNRMKANGFDAMIVGVDGEYVVQAGLFSVKENAERLANRIKAAGINAIIVEQE